MVARCFVRCLSSHSRTCFNGVWPIVATPFQENESLDLEGFTKSIRFFADVGAAGATITGVLGESNRLTDAEREALIRTAVESSPAGFPICVGTSHAGTTATAALSSMARELGAAAVMVTPTKEAVPATDTTLYEYYVRVAEANPGLPIVLQDHPASTGVHMSAELIARICADVPEIACIKLEAVPTPPKIDKIRKLWNGDFSPASNCTILTGLGALYAEFDQEQGIDGFMTGFAFPEILIAMDNAARIDNDLERARAIYTRFLPLIVYEQQPGIAVRKEIYRLRGLIKCGKIRHPGSGLSDLAASALTALLGRSFPADTDLKAPLPPSLFSELQ